MRELLAQHRLVTLTGPGGTGKTRLALQAAADVLETSPDGVWLVDLAPLADATLVPQAVAQAVGIREEPSRSLVATLTDVLRPKRLLLVLDNCEHLVEDCARLADGLLRACPHLQILATSREALGIAGETPWRVPSLSLPDPSDTVHPPPLEALTQYEAVCLFIERAVAVQPAFRVTTRNAPAVARICARLDGIPLAIELAAARVRALSVDQLLARLDDRFRLLTGGSRTALARHQTLRAAVDWSHALLSEPEQTLFRRLAVFAGGWTLEAAEAVCTGGTIARDDVLDLLTRLVDKSLVDAVDRRAAETIVDRVRASTALMPVAQLRVLGGAMARVLADYPAFAHRDVRILANLTALYTRAEERPGHERWATGFAAALRRDAPAAPGVYVNFLGDEGAARVREAYPGPTWDRLAAIKARYDPDDLFRLNPNIPPAAPRRPA